MLIMVDERSGSSFQAVFIKEEFFQLCIWFKEESKVPCWFMTFLN